MREHVAPALLAAILLCGCTDAGETFGTGGAGTGGTGSSDASKSGVGESSPEGLADLDAVMTAQRTILGQTLGVLENIEDRKDAVAARETLRAIGKQVPAVRARRLALAQAGAQPVNKIAYALDSKGLVDDMRAISLELARLADVEDVREVIENDVHPILSMFDDN